MEGRATWDELMSAQWKLRSSVNIREEVAALPTVLKDTQATIRAGHVPKWWLEAEAHLEILCKAAWERPMAAPGARKGPRMQSKEARWSENKVPGTMCVTLPQPVASLVACGLLPFFPHSQGSDCKGCLWIHSSGRPITLEETRWWESCARRLNEMKKELVMPANYPQGTLVGSVEVSEWSETTTSVALLKMNGYVTISEEIDHIRETFVVLCEKARRLVVPFQLEMSKVVGGRGLKAEGHKGLWQLQKPTLKGAESGTVDTTPASCLSLGWLGWHTALKGEMPIALEPAEAKKKIKTLQKKQRQIQDLAKRHEAGEKLEVTQVAKLATLSDLELEMQKLEAACK